MSESENGGARLNESQIADSKSPTKPTEKDRTLFCIKIDSKCTEEILYELFLQAGPIDNLIRKTDRNGSLICLVTYKHIESCEYAIQLFNGLHLFGQAIRVQLSQNPLNKSSLSFNSPGTNPPNAMKRAASSTPAMDRAVQLPPPTIGQFDPADVQQHMMSLMGPFVNQLGALMGNAMAAPQDQDQYNRSRGGRGNGEHHSRRGEYYDNRGGANNNQYNKNHQSHSSHSSWQPPVSRDAAASASNFNNQRHGRHQTYGQPNRFNNNNNQMNNQSFNNFSNRQRSRSRSPSNKRHKRF